MIHLRLLAALLLATLLLGLGSCNKQPATDKTAVTTGTDAAAGGDDAAAGQAPVHDDMRSPDASADAEGANPCQQSSENDGAAGARKLPDFQLRSPEGEISQISAHYGRPLVINFWGDWCPPCVAELPTMNTIYNARKSEFDMIAVSVGSQDAQGFWTSNKMDIPLYFDVDGKDILGLANFPTTFFLDREGKVTGFQTGAMTEDDFNIRLKDILLPAGS